MSDTCSACGHVRGYYETVAIDGLFGLAEGQMWVPHTCPVTEATQAHRRAMGYEEEYV